MTWGLSFELLVLTPFIVHGEKYILVVHPSPLPKVNTLRRPDESLLARACLSLSYLESLEKEARSATSSRSHGEHLSRM